MPRRIVLLSGRIGAGKSTLASALVTRYSAQLIKTRELIRAALPGIEFSRSGLQKAGDALDDSTSGRWVANGIMAEQNAREAEFSDTDGLIVVDAVRIEPQIEQIRNVFGRAVTHVHLTVSLEEADQRLRRANREFVDSASYAEAMVNPTEANVESLSAISDVHVNTELDRENDVVVRVAGKLGLLQPNPASYVDALIGGQYGSEGKGHIAWYLAPEYDILMRVGGPNAGHTVLSHNGYKFHTLPSGTGEAPQARLVIGPGATLSLESLRNETSDWGVSKDRLSIDRRAVIIEPEDIEFEQKTIRDTIASTAQGGGYTAARRLMRGALEPERKVRFAEDVPELMPFLSDTGELLENAFARGTRVFLEGTQGTGLSLFHGPWPHVTSRDTSVNGLLAEAGIAPAWLRKIVLVVRSYPIRVQNPDEPDATSGPMSHEISWDEVARRADQDAEVIKTRELTSTTGRKRRVGEFDWVLFRQSVHLNRPTDIALTFADYLAKKNEDARRFDQLREDTQSFVGELEEIADAPVSLISTRFHQRSIIDRRHW